MVTPHGIHVDTEGNVWVTDFAGNDEGTKGASGAQVQPRWRVPNEPRHGGAARQRPEPAQPTQRRDYRAGREHLRLRRPQRSGYDDQPGDAGRPRGRTHRRVLKYSADGTFIKEWGQIGVRHGEFRTPHALAFDAQGRLWVADRGNHRLEIFDQDGNYLESRYAYGRISGIFINDDTVYAINSESSPTNHPNWRNGVRIGTAGRGDHATAFIPPFERESRVYPRGGRGRRGRRGRQRLRRGRAELFEPGRWRVYQVLGSQAIMIVKLRWWFDLTRTRRMLTQELYSVRMRSSPRLPRARVK